MNKTVEVVGEKFIITTPNEQVKGHVMKEEMPPSEFIKRFDAWQSEALGNQSEISKLTTMLVDLEKPNKNIDLANEAINKDLEQIVFNEEGFKKLIDWLKKLHSGRMEQENKINNLKQNINFLRDKKSAMTKLLTDNKNNYDKAKRLCKVVKEEVKE